MNAETKYRRTKKGFLSKIYREQKSRSKKRGHVPPDYTLEEFRNWALSKNIFHTLFDAYKISEWDKQLAPSADRIDDYEPYSYSNIEWKTWRENHLKQGVDMISGKNRKISKSVEQYSIDGTLIDEFYSVSNASRETGVSRQNISKSCNGEINHCGGYIWKYK